MWQSKSEKIRKYYFRYWVNVNAHIMSCIIYDVINTGGKSLGSEWIWLLWITYIKQFVPSILIFYAFSIKWVWKYHCRISSSWTKYFFFVSFHNKNYIFSWTHFFTSDMWYCSACDALYSFDIRYSLSWFWVTILMQRQT